MINYDNLSKLFLCFDEGAAPRQNISHHFFFFVINYDNLSKLFLYFVEGAGRTLEVKELSAKFTTDLIGTTAYGLKVNSLNNPNAEFRNHGREMVTYNVWRSIEVTSLFFAPQVAQPLRLKFFSSNSTKFLREVFWGTIVEREKSGVKRNDLIDLLIELKRTQADSPDKNIFGD